MRLMTIVMWVSAVLFAVGPAAQGPPDFSGKWVLAPDPTAPATQRGGRMPPASLGSGWGADITVTQDATRLAIEYATFARGDMQPPATFVYLLNGAESLNTINMGRGPQEQRSRTSWDGGKLVIITTHSFNASQCGDPMTSETRHVLSLESPTQLIVETTRSAVMGGQPSTTRTVYRKGGS